MNLEHRLTRAAHHVADGLNPPDVDLDAVRARARSNQRRTTSLAVMGTVAVVAAVIGVGVTVSGGRNSSTPPPPAVTSSNPAEPRFSGTVYFPADAGAGDELKDPIEFGHVEVNPQPMDIYVRRESEPVRRIISSKAHERCPAVSPDGARLAYLEDTSVVVVPLDAAGEPGTAELRMDLRGVHGYGPKLHIGPPCPRWSPDGTRLAYTVLRGQRPAELRVATPDGEGRVLANIPVADRGPAFAWSPGGDAVAYGTGEGVWVAPVDGGRPELVWRRDADPRPDSLNGAIAVSWSRSNQLAITNRILIPTDSGGARERHTVHVVDLDSGRDRTLEPIHIYDYGAVWSPDGSRLAFVGGDGHILVTGPAGRPTTRLKPPGDLGRLGFWDVSWSPDGDELLALARSDDRGFALVTLTADGSSADVLTPWTWGFDWINLDDVSWSRR